MTTTPTTNAAVTKKTSTTTPTITAAQGTANAPCAEGNHKLTTVALTELESSTKPMPFEDTAITPAAAATPTAASVASVRSMPNVNSFRLRLLSNL